MAANPDDPVIEWLLEGDPAVRWQVMRDLLDEPGDVWEAERRRLVDTGWVAEFLASQGADGEWPKGRWTASTWTLPMLVACGLPHDHPSPRTPLEGLLGRFMPPGEEVDGAFLLRRVDLCHLGFWLGSASYFMGDDPRLGRLGEAVLSAQMDDGGWNCQVRNKGPRATTPFARRSTCSRTSPAIADERVGEAVELLREQRKPNGRWSLQKRIPGTLLAEMEKKPGAESRWNTLRALRVLRTRAEAS